MKTVLNLIKRDLLRALRDNTLLYVILSPIILAVVALLILPSVTNPEFNVIIDEKLEHRYVYEVLSQHKIRFEKEDQIKEAVKNENRAIGVLSVPMGYSVLVSDTEAAGAEDFIKTQLMPFLNQEALVSEDKASDQSAREYVLVFILITGILLGGMVVGFLIVEERALKTLKASSVSPLTIVKYMFSKSFISFIIPFVIGIIVIFILIGGSWSLGDYLMLSLGGFPLGILLGLITGYLADNQIAALGIVKLLMPVFLTVPVVSMFVPASLAWIFFPFPNYWFFEALRLFFVSDYTAGVGGITAAGLSFVLGSVLIVVFMPKCAKRFGL